MTCRRIVLWPLIKGKQDWFPKLWNNHKLYTILVSLKLGEKKKKPKCNKRKILFPRWIRQYCGILKSSVVHLPSLKVVQHISVQNRFIASIFTLISCFSVHPPSKYLEDYNGYVECFKSWPRKWAPLWERFDWLIVVLSPICESLWLHSFRNELLDLNFLHRGAHLNFPH